MIEQFRKYIQLAGIDRRLGWIVVVVLAVGVSGLEALGALLIYGLLALVTGTEQAVALPVVGDLRRLFPALDHESLVLWMTAVVAAFFVMRAIAVLTSEYVMARVTENAGTQLSKRLAHGYLAMPYTFHLRRNSAELIRNAYSTVRELVVEVFRPLVKIIAEGTIAIGILTVLLLSAPIATVLVIAAVIPTGYLLLRLVYPRLRRLGAESQRTSRETLQSLQQSLEGIRDIKVLGRERYFDSEFGRSRAELGRIRYRREVFRNLPGVGLETLIVLLISGVFAAVIVREGEATEAIPLLGLFGYAALRLKPSFTSISKSINALRFSSAGIDDVYADLRLFERVGARIPTENVEPLRFERAIRLDDVSFRYDEGGADALERVTILIQRGESLGVVGPTGGGKTTLVDVTMGLLRPTSGHVKIDGVDIRGIESSWQMNIGVVPQNLFLVDDTLRRNIALGARDREVDERRILEVTRLAQLESVVDSLPEGLDTVVGERGIRLSGGQRQRIAIARALYRDPEVLVFDEGTSALDNRTEAQLLEALDELRGNHTLIMVAHRLSTVRSCDRIVVLDQGRIVDAGTYEELLKRSEQFRRIAL